MLCTHKTASSASLVLEICHQFNNPFLNQFSSIFGGNCIKLCLPLLLSLFSNYELFMYFCFCSFFHSYGSFNRDIFNILDLLWVSCTLFIHIFTLFMYRKSSCTFICQVSPLTSSCQFSTFHQCSLLPQASLSFI